MCQRFHSTVLHNDAIRPQTQKRPERVTDPKKNDERPVVINEVNVKQSVGGDTHFNSTNLDVPRR